MPQAAKTLQTDFSNDTDADLLTMISWKEEDHTAARKALGELYRRHASYLAAVCMRAYRKSIGDDAVRDLVNDTFLRVFSHAAASFEPSDETDTENIRNAYVFLTVSRLWPSFLLFLVLKVRSEETLVDPEIRFTTRYFA